MWLANRFHLTSGFALFFKGFSLSFACQLACQNFRFFENFFNFGLLIDCYLSDVWLATSYRFALIFQGLWLAKWLAIWSKINYHFRIYLSNNLNTLKNKYF